MCNVPPRSPKAFLIPGDFKVSCDPGKDDHTMVLRVLLRPPQLFVVDATRIEPEEDTDENRRHIS